MSAKKYNGMKRAAEWLGKRVKLTRRIGNGFAILDAGTAGIITGQSAGGLTFTSDKCTCCSLSLHIRRLGYFDVELVDAMQSGVSA